MLRYTLKSIIPRQLEVEGGVRIESAGVRFTEIIELSGITESSEGITYINMPSGWNADNTRILNIEIQHNNDGYWIGIGVTDKEISYLLYPDHIILNHNPDNTSLNSASYRILLMKVE